MLTHATARGVGKKTIKKYPQIPITFVSKYILPSRFQLCKKKL